MDLRALLYSVRRHKAIFCVLFMLGLAAGTGLTLIRPPLLASKVLVVIPDARYIGTQAVIADSDPVLIGANRGLIPPLRVETLRHRVSVSSVTSTVIAITAFGKTARQAQNTANAVARSYVAFVKSPKIPGGKTSAQVLENATQATGTTLPVRAAQTAALGALLGAVLGIIVAAAMGQPPRQRRAEPQTLSARVSGTPAEIQR